MSTHTKLTPKPTDIALIGVGCLFPGASSAREYWSNILKGTDCMTDIPASHWDINDYFDPDLKVPDKSYCKRGGFLPYVEFDPLEFGIAPRDLDVIDTAQLLAMKVAREAMRDAGYLDSGKPWDKNRTAAIVGTTSITELATPLNMRLSYPTIAKILRGHGLDEATVDSVIKQYGDSFPIWQENSFPGVLGNVISGRIANSLDLGGTNCVIDAACASALGAVKMAIDSLVAGTCDMVVTGGVDTVNNIFMYLCFSKTPAFSKEGKSRPFDKNSDGILIGEGIGLVVMKRLADAVRDQDRIYAVLRAMGSSSDGKAKSIYQPVSAGQKRAVNQAYAMAGVSPRQITLVEAHGTGTPVGDMAEFAALRELYGENSQDRGWCALGSVKSQIGHTKASAGIAGLIKLAFSLYHKILPPTINVEEPNPKMGLEESPFYLNSALRPWVMPDGGRRIGACSAFGFGGTNFHALLEEFDSEAPLSDLRTESHEIFVISGQTPEECIASSRQLLALLQNSDDFHELARQNQYEAKGTVLASLVAKDTASAIEKINLLIQHLGQESSPLQKNGVFYFPPACKNRQERLGLLFSGQGSQYLHMARQLLEYFPSAGRLLQKIDRLRSDLQLQPLSDVIYPKTSYLKDATLRQDELLRRTDLAQASLGFVNLAYLQILKQMGLKPKAVAGHSFGELTALFCADVISEDEYLRLTFQRGELMRDSSTAQSSSMAAVLGDIASLQKDLERLNQQGTDVRIANFNTAKQAVIAGTVKDLDRVCDSLQKSGLTIKRLNVSAAFHTPQMAPAVKKFGDFVAGLKSFKIPTLPVFSTMTAKPYPESIDGIQLTLRDQLLYPVRFKDLVEAMQKEVDCFLEVGPSKVCKGLAEQITGLGSDKIYSCDGNKSIEPFLQLIAQFISLGWIQMVPELFGARASAGQRRKKSAVTVLLNGANYLREETRNAPTAKAKHPLPPKPAQGIQNPAATTLHPAVQPVAPTGAKNPASELSTKNPVLHQKQSLPPLKTKPRPLTRSSQMHPDFQSMEEFNRYRMRLVDVQEQFLLMQREANRIMERMMGMEPSSAPIEQNYSAPQTPVQYMPPAPIQTLARQAPAPRPLAVPEPVPAPLPVAASVQPKGSILTSMFEKREEPSPVATAPAAKIAASSENTAILDFLMQTIADKTGFPREMLNSGMDLEQDLAVDSIRRVEILGAVAEKFPQAPTIGPAQLGVLKSIGDIVQFLGGSIQDKAVASAPVQTEPLLSSSAISSEAKGQGNTMLQALMQIISEKTGFPMDMLNSDMELEQDLAVDSIRRVEILGAMQEQFPSAPKLGPAQLGVLKTIGDIISFLAEPEPLVAGKKKA